MEQLKYEVEDRTLAELLGVQNFTNEESAMLELVKNAYDAQAKCVILDFSNGNLVIIDNGVGMSDEDIRTHWMHVGKSNKGYFSALEYNGKQRVLAGSKGVGRFALARLGKSVIMYTKKENKNLVVWETDWEKSTIENNLSEKEKEFCEHGTRIEISSLRDRWTARKILNLTNYLSVTYNDDAMRIKIVPEPKQTVHYVFQNPVMGCTHVSMIHLVYDGKGTLTVHIDNDEFLDEAKQYCDDLNLHKYDFSVNIFHEFSGNNEFDLTDEELKTCLEQLGGFFAKFYFSLKSSTAADKENFLYKYGTLPSRLDYGIVLYRNAFSIASFEGRRDWLELNKRVRSSPAAATHPTGAWRVRANQISGYVMIDKIRNPELKDMTNRQGLEENVYYKLFIKILTTGISRFEEYRQHIIRKISKKNDKTLKSPTPVLETVLKKPESVHNLTKDQIRDLHNELDLIKKENTSAERQKREVEDRYHYDVRILNAFVTIGLKAAAIAHEANNDKNSIDQSYKLIVDALNEYGFWEELNSREKTKYVYRNVPLLLLRCKEINEKTSLFMKTMLEQIEKKKFQVSGVNVKEVLDNIAKEWMRDYATIKIKVLIDESLQVNYAADVFNTIFDNLILNSWQQNHTSKEDIVIEIRASMTNGMLNMSYSDNGVGLNDKYKNNPKRILEVHETSRTDGHGLGMWIVNNTISMTGGEVLEIDGCHGFSIKFCLGDGL